MAVLGTCSACACQSTKDGYLKLLNFVTLDLSVFLRLAAYLNGMNLSCALDIDTVDIDILRERSLLHV